MAARCLQAKEPDLTAMSSEFFLHPLDGGPRVPVGPGQTVIGRGPLLGITDKRVSRRHAILEVVDSQLRIKPIHKNPCFHQSSEKSQLSPMETHVWSRLHPGDSFSLLLDKYAFRVSSTQSEVEMESTLRNSQMLDEDDILNEMRKSPVVNLPDKTAVASQLQGSPEVTKAKCPTVDPMARDVRHHSNLVLISRREKTTEIMHVTTPWAFKLVSREGHTRLTHKLIVLFR